jgi:hypothetical protein
LASGGVAKGPPSILDELVPWCWDRGETTGDARYCSLSRSLGIIQNTFDEQGESGGVSSRFLRRVDEIITRNLSAVLDAETPEEGALLARSLRMSILDLYREDNPKVP